MLKLTRALNLSAWTKMEYIYPNPLGTECLYPKEMRKDPGRSYSSTTTGSQSLAIPVALLQSTVKYFDCDSSGSNHQTSLTKLEGSPAALVDRR